MSSDKSFIYFIKSNSTGNIKIGRSITPKVRLKSLKVIFKDRDLELIGIICGGATEEKELHNKFKMYHCGREWFIPDMVLMNYIKNNTLDIEVIDDTPDGDMHIGITFPQEETELYLWALEQAKKKPISWVGREAYKCLRFCKKLFGENWEEKLDRFMDVQ